MLKQMKAPILNNDHIKHHINTVLKIKFQYSKKETYLSLIKRQITMNNKRQTFFGTKLF